ncbi:MAG: PAQR family membrane homeostasis protein TrhA [Gaiellaceae bacterium]
MRGVFHLYAFVGFAVLGATLVAGTSGGRERLAAAAFGASLVLTFGVSALYHRVDWRPSARRVMRRLDHASIYLLIAGTYTPYGLLVLSGAWQFSILGVVWIGAAVAIVQQVFWLDAPRWVPVAAGIVLGWVGVLALPQIVAAAGFSGSFLVAAGGVFYTLGAVVYAVKRPDFRPAVFGFHELFHVLTVLAASCQFAAVTLLVAS